MSDTKKAPAKRSSKAKAATQAAPATSLVLGDRWDNFRWWCDGGNHEMCAAVLWRNGILSPADASRAVRQIAEGATC